MYINCERVGEGTWQLYCHSCGEALDLVDTQELKWHMLRDKPILCMGCDSTADTISKVLWQDETPYLLIVDRTMIGCDWPTTMAALTKTCTYLRQELYKAVNPHSLILEREFEVKCDTRKRHGE